ncbi:CbiQ family ECF transporter T component [Actinotalea sp.]|uniref:CbiQ family ECF transporter T component n=1 Tax=Actinotalea sp. TaxID=1872145 RepID=UPI00356B2EBE
MHPWAWWSWALGLTVAATRTTSTPALGLIVVAALLVATLSRGDGPRGRAFPGFVLLAVAVVVLRLVFHVVVGIKTPGTVVLDLPRVPMPDWAVGVELFGPVTTTGLATAATGGLRLAALVLCIGAAATLTSAARTLRTLPAALHQLGTAVVIATNVAPALVAAAARVRRAQRLRGVSGRGPRAVVSTAMPVLADALDQSLALAASMDSRGFAGTHGRRDRRVTPLLLTALLSTTLGTYGLLDPTAPRWMGLPLLVLGAASGAVGSLLAGRLVRRTRFRRETWGPGATLLTACGAGAAGLVLLTQGAASGPAVATLAALALAPLLLSVHPEVPA